MVTYVHAHAHALERPCRILGTMSEKYCSFCEKCSDMMLESFWHFFHYKKCKIRIFSSFFSILRKFDDLKFMRTRASKRQCDVWKIQIFFKNTTMTLESLMYFFTKRSEKGCRFFFHSVKSWKFEDVCQFHLYIHAHAHTRARACQSACTARESGHARIKVKNRDFR